MATYTKIDEDADETIKSEESYNANIGFEMMFINKMFTFRSDYFYSRYKNKIIRIFDENFPRGVYTNIEGMTTQGVENIFIASIAKIADIIHLNLNLSYTYMLT